MVGGNSVRATGGMNAGKTVYQDENEFGESAAGSAHRVAAHHGLALHDHNALALSLIHISNLDMVVEYKPELKGFMTTNAAGAQGQGIEMATAIGAGTVDMDQIQIHPTVEANTAALITEGLRGDGAVLINAEGKRFIEEVGTRDVVSACLLYTSRCV